jgi:hypothetical protein
MLMPLRFAEGVADGSITLTFRRWKRLQVVVGHRYRTAAGRIQVDAIDVVDPARISGADARRAGFVDAEAVRQELRGEDALPVYRIRFHAVQSPDERTVLAHDDALDADARAEIDRRLDRLDNASSHGRWTRAVLQTIAEQPGVRAPDLAQQFGRDTQPFKLDVRKLKNLGLTISLRVGYELSPRGRAYLDADALGADGADAEAER